MSLKIRLAFLVLLILGLVFFIIVERGSLNPAFSVQSTEQSTSGVGPENNRAGNESGQSEAVWLLPTPFSDNSNTTIAGIANKNGSTTTTPGAKVETLATSTNNTRLHDNQARSMLKANKIDVRSSGNCSDRNNPKCTSLEGIKLTTIQGLITFKKASGCPSLIVTGGTETGHEPGPYSHGTGYKVDINPAACATKYIQSSFKYIGLRDYDSKAKKRVNPEYRSVAGNLYTLEVSGNHWDILYFNS